MSTFVHMRINEIIGSWFGEYRRAHGLTMEQIADAARTYGANWRSANISRMESGGNSIDALPTILILFATLNDLTGDEISLSTPFSKVQYSNSEYEDSSFIELNSSYIAPLQSVSKALRDNPVHLGRLLSTTYLGYDKEKPRYELTGYDHGTPVFTAQATHFPPTAAERRLSEKLAKHSDSIDASDIAVAAICDVLYGHSLDEEAAKRAGEGATPQKRGRVTRVLAGEILDYMRKVAAKLED